MTAGGVEAADPEPESLLARTAKGAGWVILWRMFNRLLGLISTLFLVRLLRPDDFGLVTLAMSFAQAVESVSSLGVEEAVIREHRPSRDLYDSAFTINVLRGVATGAIVAAAAVPVARFFDDPRLVSVMLVVAAGSAIAALENIGIVDFRRDIAFDREFVLMAVPRFISAVVAIGLAFLWHSYWALICSIQVSIILRTALGYAMHTFRPRLRLAAWRQIAGFSFWSWLLSLGALVSDRCPGFIIGRLFNITEVGVFSLGTEIASLPTTELISPLARACFSGFASARGGAGTQADTRSVFLRVLGGTTLLALPAGFGLSLIADPIVKLAFGSTWSGATGVIQVLGVALTVAILGYISSALMNAHALLRIMFIIQLGSIAVRFALLVVLAMRYGLIGAAIGVGFSTAIEHGLTLAVTIRYLQLRVSDIALVTWRSLFGALVMAAGLWGMGLGWNSVAGSAGVLLTDIGLAVPLGAGLYGMAVAAAWLLVGRPAGAERDMFGLIYRTLSKS